MIAPLHALALAAPDVLDRLPDVELALLAFDASIALRPEQRLPRGTWRSYGALTGRGWGKTRGIATEINRRVAAGAMRAPVLVGPTLERVDEVQVAALLATSAPWCPCERYADGVRWANGVVAEAATSEVERPSSGSNYDFAWLTELVRWNPTTRRAAFDDITTATRSGPCPQYVWDTTSSGKNELILFLLAQAAANPDAHRIVRGTIFENPVLTRAYVLDEIRKYVPGTRRYEEELLGLAFAEAGGALWHDDWIASARVSSWPSSPELVVLGLDPALSGDKTADEVGLGKAARVGRHVYVDDLSAKMPPEEYAIAVVRECRRDASGVVVERNHVGQHARDLIRVHAKLEGMRIELLPDPTRPFPPRREGVIYVREVVSNTAKESRAAPIAALYAAGLVHHVGTLAALEHQQTTWEPGSSRSPNRLDANVFAVGECGEVALAAPPPPGRVAAAARMAAQLRERMRAAGRAGTVR